MNTPILFGTLALAASLLAGVSHAQDTPLVHEGTVEASVEDVWKAFTTKEGIESWMVPHAEIDLRVGGLMRTHYNKDGKIGDPGTIENMIISYDPKRMLSIRIAKAPDGFPFPNAAKGMWTVIYFDAVGPAQTRVTVRGLGFTRDEESQKMRAFFERGNGYTVEQLKKHFAKKS